MSLGIRTKEEFGEQLLSGLFPSRCPLCGRVPKEEGVLACPSCQEKLIYVKQPACLKCGVPLMGEDAYCGRCQRESHAFHRNLSVWEYSSPIKESLYQFKYHNKREYARFYGREALRMYGSWLERQHIEAVIPIPLHKSRQRVRGYNQSACFGTAIAKGLSLPFYKDFLFRTKKTLPQKSLSAGERNRNLQGAFSLGKQFFPAERVLLVDDIYTTGSTLDEAARVLKEAGVDMVYTMTIAIGHYGNPNA